MSTQRTPTCRRAQAIHRRAIRRNRNSTQREDKFHRARKVLFEPKRYVIEQESLRRRTNIAIASSRVATSSRNRRNIAKQLIEISASAQKGTCIEQASKCRQAHTSRSPSSNQEKPKAPRINIDSASSAERKLMNRKSGLSSSRTALKFDVQMRPRPDTFLKQLRFHSGPFAPVRRR